MKTTITAIFDAVCQCHDSRFRETLQRFSNNACPKFTDEELISIYLWGKAKQVATKKAIYRLVKEVMPERFPHLPSYQAFCRRLNRIAAAFLVLADIWRKSPELDPFSHSQYVVDSCPIALAKHSYSNTGKVAKGLCSLCYNSTRKEWYYGVKLHVFGRLRLKKLPWPCAMVVSSASLCDLWAAKDIVLNYHPISHGTLFADRAYIDKDWKEELSKSYDIDIVTPRKKAKGDVLISEDAFSTHVSSVRQPIESFFHWLNFHTGIQNAQFVRSEEGLYLHIFSSLALAAFLLRFNS